MKYKCSICGYEYDEAAGIPEKGIRPGTRWEDLPSDWSCPICGAPKSAFVPVSAAPAPAAPHQTSAPGQVSDRAASRPAPGAVSCENYSLMELSTICSNLAKGCEK